MYFTLYSLLFKWSKTIEDIWNEMIHYIGALWRI